MKFFEILFGPNKKPDRTTVEAILRMEQSKRDLKTREIAWWTCVNMIANALGRADFRTFRQGVEIQEREAYLWNVEPNANENSSAFIHHLVARLCLDNEALIVATRQRNGYDALVVADEWEAGKLWPSKQREYTGVRVGELTYDKTFRESDVLHVKWSGHELRGVLDTMAASYRDMIDAEAAAMEYATGRHLKVHVDQVASGQKDFEAQFKARLESQLKPFLTSRTAVLPEFDGYTYSDMSGEGATKDSVDGIQKLTTEIIENTARGFLIPSVLLRGDTAGTADAEARFLSAVIDPIADQLQEEINRKRYGYEDWQAGTYMRIDTSSIQHYDMFAASVAIERVISSGLYSVNEVRRAANQPRIDEEWADKHYMTLNIERANTAARQMDGAEGEENG